jgi:hypothetical protein
VEKLILLILIEFGVHMEKESALARTHVFWKVKANGSFYF